MGIVNGMAPVQAVCFYERFNSINSLRNIEVRPC